MTLGGRDHYLGQHGTKESRALYKRLIAEWPASGHTTAGLCGGDSNPVTVDDVIAAYWRHLVA